MILCLINKYRAPMLKKIIQDTDPNAFVFSTNVSEVIGNGFYIPTAKVKKKIKFNPNIKKENSTTPSVMDDSELTKEIDAALKRNDIKNTSNNKEITE